MSESTTIIGGPVSPYVRKVMAVCDLKGAAYRIDPIIPFQGNDEFSRLSPLRRISVLIDDQLTLADSTVIAEFLTSATGRRGFFRTLRLRGHERVGSRSSRILALAMCSSGACLTRRSLRRVCGSRARRRRDRASGPRRPAGCNGLPRNDRAPRRFRLRGAGGCRHRGCRALRPRWAATGAELAAWPKTVAWVARIEAIPALAR